MKEMLVGLIMALLFVLGVWLGSTAAPPAFRPAPEISISTVRPGPGRPLAALELDASSSAEADIWLEGRMKVCGKEGPQLWCIGTHYIVVVSRPTPQRIRFLIHALDEEAEKQENRPTPAGTPVGEEKP